MLFKIAKSCLVRQKLYLKKRFRPFIIRYMFLFIDMVCCQKTAIYNINLQKYSMLTNVQ